LEGSKSRYYWLFLPDAMALLSRRKTRSLASPALGSFLRVSLLAREVNLKRRLTMLYNTDLVYKPDGWYWRDDDGNLHGPFAGLGSHAACEREAREYDETMMRLYGGLQRES